MYNPRLLIFSFLFIGFTSTAQAQTRTFTPMPLSLDRPLTTIAFGSCNNQKKEQKMWPYIAADKPNLWIWTGDIIYADTEDMRLKADEYQKQKVDAAYQRFTAQVPTIGVWDDHDYGDNDACKTYPKKEQSKKLLMDFLDVDDSRPVHQREGVYQSYTFGPEGQKVKVILLDTRYFRDELEKNPVKGGQRYLPNKTGDVLGYKQWKWLERELTNSTADVHLIVSSIQLLAKEHDFEKWANFPSARRKFFKLMEKTNPACPLLISGDRHIAEISMIEFENTPTHLYEITSSGLTHTWSKYKDEPNHYRVGDLIAKLNYGLLHIDWSGEQPKLTAEIRGLEGSLYQQCQLE
jgi:alkaline phosphatase D